MPLQPDVLAIDPAAETRRLAEAIARQTRRDLRRQGLVVGVSGGVDSAVALGLAVEAVGRERVVGILMPDRHSSPESVPLARTWCEQLGVEHVVEDVTPALTGLGCYRRQTEAIRRLFPEFDEDRDRFKIHMPPGVLEQDRVNFFLLTVEFADGRTESRRLGVREFLQIVAATNMKQRTRMTMLYYHAEARNWAVLGTCNRNEWIVGFIVKHGDIAVDVKPLQHLYKSQVYALARHLGVPQAIVDRPPSSDTYSADQTQEEFYFSLPWEKMDLLIWAWEHEVPPAEAAEPLGLTEEQVARAYRDLTTKSRTTAHMRRMPLACVED
ncbi:MAG: NAD(+) synthase [Acidobacteria bacterium]|nr:MAG: NAD(+) synthase [Acidobacteriota bacterium]